ncbi:MAG: hypothetical protein KAS18_11125 [Calditrichia bacterium]|nr:hypothetical protein [Calditrichia bacterium]
MKLTNDVIIDLLPLYFSSEASEDTKTLVNTYFEQNPEFAEEAKKSSEQIITNDIPITLTKEDEMKTLNKTKKFIRLRSWLLGFAIFFTLAPASVAHIDGRTYWFAFEAPLTALGYALIGAIFWLSYFITRHKLRTTEF